MSDSDKEVHQRPVPDPALVTPEEKDEQQANRLAIGFALFIPMGIALGLTILDNIGLGVAIGLAAGALYSFVAPQLSQ